MDRLACRVTVGIVVALVAAAGVVAQEAQRTGPIDWDAVKRAWDDLLPAQRESYDAALRDEIAERQAKGAGPAKTPADICSMATFEISDLPYHDAGSTVGLADNVFLSAAGICAGGGAQFSGTGFGPDRAYRIRVHASCDVRITMAPQADVDLALYVTTDCDAADTKCVRVDDSGGRGVAEQVTFTASRTETYFVLVDGFNGQEGTYTLDIEETGSTGCRLVPVELQSFSVE